MRTKAATKIGVTASGPRLIEVELAKAIAGGRVHRLAVAAIRYEVGHTEDRSEVAAKLAERLYLDRDPRAHAGTSPVMVAAIRQAALGGVRWDRVRDAAVAGGDMSDASPVESLIVGWLRADAGRKAKAGRLRDIDLQMWISGMTRGVEQACYTTPEDEQLFSLGVAVQLEAATGIDWAEVLLLAADPLIGQK